MPCTALVAFIDGRRKRNVSFGSTSHRAPVSQKVLEDVILHSFFLSWTLSPMDVKKLCTRRKSRIDSQLEFDTF
jgi:hypothetical protein